MSTIPLPAPARPDDDPPPVVGELRNWLDWYNHALGGGDCVSMFLQRGGRIPARTNLIEHRDVRRFGSAIQRNYHGAAITLARLDDILAEHFPDLSPVEAARLPVRRVTSRIQGTDRPTPEGGQPPNGRRDRIPADEANTRVREWLMQNAKENPAAVTRDAIAAATGVSTGMVSNTPAWKAFRDRRDADKKPGIREIPLSQTMQASIPAGSLRPEQLVDELTRDQQDELAQENRRHDRRHKPRHRPS